MSLKAHKKGKHSDSNFDQAKRQQNQNDIFKLQYLNNTMSYIIPNRGAVNSCLQLNPNILDTLISSDLSSVEIGMIEKVKSMKEICDENQYVKYVQDCGDYINYDIPKEYQQSIDKIEKDLKIDHRQRYDSKRIRDYFPEAPEIMNNSEIQFWDQRVKEKILGSFISNARMVPEDQEVRSNGSLYRDIFNEIEQGREESQSGLFSKREGNMMEGTISLKLKTELDSREKKGTEKSQRSRKIIKGQRKGEGKVDGKDEYLPKQGKKGTKSEDPQGVQNGTLKEVASVHLMQMGPGSQIEGQDKMESGQQSNSALEPYNISQAKSMEVKSEKGKSVKPVKQPTISQKDSSSQQIKSKRKPRRKPKEQKKQKGKPVRYRRDKKKESKVEQNSQKVVMKDEKMLNQIVSVVERQQVSIGIQASQKKMNLKQQADKIIFSYNKYPSANSLESKSPVEIIVQINREAGGIGVGEQFHTEPEPAIANLPNNHIPQAEPIPEQMQIEAELQIPQSQLAPPIISPSQNNLLNPLTYVPQLNQPHVNIQGPQSSNLNRSQDSNLDSYIHDQ